MYIRLFLLFMKNIHEESADHDSRRIWNGGQKCRLCRCTVAAVRNAAEYIAVVPGYYKAHQVGENEGKDIEQMLQFFHMRLLVLQFFHRFLVEIFLLILPQSRDSSNVAYI